MNKKLLYFLAFLGLIFAYYLIKAFLGGVSSTTNPNAQIQKAKCLADCRKGDLSTNCDQFCLEQSINK